MPFSVCKSWAAHSPLFVIAHVFVMNVLDNPTIQCQLCFHYCFRREFQTTLNNNLHVFRMKLIEKFCSLDTMITTTVYGCN